MQVSKVKITYVEKVKTIKNCCFFDGIDFSKSFLDIVINQLFYDL